MARAGVGTLSRAKLGSNRLFTSNKLHTSVEEGKSKSKQVFLVCAGEAVAGSLSLRVQQLVRRSTACAVCCPGRIAHNSACLLPLSCHQSTFTTMHLLELNGLEQNGLGVCTWS